MTNDRFCPVVETFAVLALVHKDLRPSLGKLG
jgi:hypothetical protein